MGAVELRDRDGRVIGITEVEPTSKFVPVHVDTNVYLGGLIDEELGGSDGAPEGRCVAGKCRFELCDLRGGDGEFDPVDDEKAVVSNGEVLVGHVGSPVDANSTEPTEGSA